MTEGAPAPQFHYSAPADAPVGRARPSRFGRVLWGLMLLFFFCLFSVLCVWQIKRLGWKENLLAAVHTNMHLPPIPAPPKAGWSKINTDSQAYNYRAVQAEGHFLPDKQILVKASADLGPLDQTGGAGFWVMAPLAQADGSLIFINRGFIPMDQAANIAGYAPAADEVKITGLLRLSEGGGHLFTKNDPAHNIWYTRQIPAFAAALGLPAGEVAPYFIDADKTANPGGRPRGGLTVVSFPNNHLAYAITWFCGAIGTLIAAVLVFRKRS